MPDSNSLPKLVDPLVFDTYSRPQVWGGRLLSELLGRALPTDGPYGESWDLCAQKLHTSRLVDGSHAGRDLADLWANCGNDLTGNENTQPFPLLFKWLECRELLSLQVHPGDEMAQRVLNEPYGKSEAWIVIFAEPNAKIYAGIKRGITREDVVSHLKAGTLAECLHSFTPSPGDCISIPAGTIHAAGGGLVMAEVQQSSDATFRLYDWNRLGLDGKPRPLQIDRALEATDWNQGPVSPIVPMKLASTDDGVSAEKLVDGNGFRIERYSVSNSLQTPYPNELTIWMVLEGTAELSHCNGEGYYRRFCRGQTVMIPASGNGTTWKSVDEVNALTLLCVRLA